MDRPPVLEGRSLRILSADGATQVEDDRVGLRRRDPPGPLGERVDEGIAERWHVLRFPVVAEPVGRGGIEERLVCDVWRRPDQVHQWLAEPPQLRNHSLALL